MANSTLPLRVATPATAWTRLALMLMLCVAPRAQAEDWPCWRGPRGDGSSLDTQLPVVWDGTTGKNVRWKVALPGTGHSSPIIAGRQVLLTACNETTTERLLLCLDRDSGQTRWQTTIFQGPLETIHAFNSRASSTPATDGELVFVAFMRTDGQLIPAPNVGTPRDITAGRIVVAAYDFAGHRRWQVEPGAFISAHGFASSPVLYEDLVIVNGDHDGDSYLVALDRQTGVERWRYKRAYGIRSYVTPLIREVDGRTQMVLAGSKQVVSLDPRDGSVHWFLEGPTEQVVASMLFAGDLFYMTCGYPDHFVVAIRPDGHGDVTQTAIAWQSTQARAYVPSPVIVDNFLIVADDRGTANCFDATSGTRHWQARLGSGFNASLLHANGLVYCAAQDGQTHVIRPGQQLDLVATNSLGETINSTPAASDGQLFVRGEHSLYCLQAANVPAPRATE